MEDNEKVQGRTYTSNHVKMLKHMDKLQLIQDGKRPSPVMFHISLGNPCNLTCSFCCFANREMKEVMPYERAIKAIDSFYELGTRAMEITGGGESTLHPKFHEIVEYAYKKGFKIGVCTNGTTLERWAKKNTWSMLSWIRLGLYGFDESYKYALNVLSGLPLTISAAYVCDLNLATSKNPNVLGNWVDTKGRRLSKNFQNTDNFYRMLDWVEENKIPTRIAFNAIKPREEVEKDINTIRELMATRDLKYAFLSDFNYKGERRNSNCYLHMLKPSVFTNGNVYVCASYELSPENNYMADEKFKLCDIEGIVDFYNQGVTTRTHTCKFCKYAQINELVDDVLMPTEHNDFA